MPNIRISVRNPVTAAVIRCLGACTRCRSPLRHNFEPCTCGNRHLDTRGIVTTHLSNTVAGAVKWFAPRWRYGKTEHPKFIYLRSAKSLSLFQAVAICSTCGGSLTKTLNCMACGRSYKRNYRAVLLPAGITNLFHRIALLASGMSTSGRFETLGARGNRRRRSVPANLRTMYELQKGACYYCRSRLGPLGSRGAYVRDHLVPILSSHRSSSHYRDYDNLVLTCWPCNERKGALSEAQFWHILKRQHGAIWVTRREIAMEAPGVGKRSWTFEYWKNSRHVDSRRRTGCHARPRVISATR